jgi:large subunit ribosomal protein L23
MSTLKHYDIGRSPVITEKATLRVRAEPGGVQRFADATKPEIKAAVEALFGQGEGSEHPVRKGKVKRFRGMDRPPVDVKKAVVTLKTASPST